MLDVELVLRFSAWVNRGWTALKSKNREIFLDKEMKFGTFYKTSNLNKLCQQFKNAVELSFSTFGPDRVFRRYKPGFQDDEKDPEKNP